MESSDRCAWPIVADRYFDIGPTEFLGYVVLCPRLTREKNAYGVILPFFGFFVTLATAVNSMSWLMFLKGDPKLQAGSLVVFGALRLMAWIGLPYFVKDRLAKKVR